MINIETAVVYDIETYPNTFTLDMECLTSGVRYTWEISHYRDDRQALIEWFNYLNQTQTSMIGYNNINFDYPVIHFIFMNPQATVEQIYEFSQLIINNKARFNPYTVWADKRFAPQIDLYKIYHFDNKAKRTSLKALQVNMRLPSVVDMPIEWGTFLTQDQVEHLLKPYNVHDVQATKHFASISMDAMTFRVSLIEEFGVDVMNWPDTKIGERMMEKKLGQELCYDWSSGKKQKRQTIRTRVALNDVIFPYISFQNPEFNRILNYLRDQTLTPDEMKEFDPDKPPIVQTKGVFKGLKATVGGVDYYFGTGGLHASLYGKKCVATEDWLIRDIDVASLYPSIAIVNRLAPEHLGDRFVDVYAELPKERKVWQKQKGKKCVEANTIKLAANGVYGNSNSPFSVFFDAKYTMTTTINGQLMLCMLAERLVNVPTLQIIQANTDGITYFVHKDHEPTAAEVCKQWEAFTLLVLEDVDYSRMWIRDVNNYVAEDVDGNLKLKGAYWTPDPTDYARSISECQPPAWHKDLGNVVSIRAAVAHMVHGVDPETFIRMTTNPYDFMCRVKVGRKDKLIHGGQEVQKTGRYFVSNVGQPLAKIMPPLGPAGMPKKARGVSDADYTKRMNETGWQWCETVCQKNKEVYPETRQTNIQAGHVVTICNDVSDFDFSNVNYKWYVDEAVKLIIT